MGGNQSASREPKTCWELGYTPEWWSERLEPDGYIHQNLCRHLAEAGHSRELVRLLFKPQWAERQVDINAIVILSDDFAEGVGSLRDALSEESKEERRETGKALRLISDCVILSSGFVGRNKVELFFQLHGRLLAHVEKFRGIRKYLGWIETEGKRPKVLCSDGFLVQAGGPNIKIIPIGIAILCMTLLNDGRQIAVGCIDGTTAVVNLEESKVEKSWSAHKDEVYSIVAVKDGTRIVTGSFGGTAKVWHVESGDCLATFNGHTDYIICVGLMNHEGHVVSCSYDETVQIWDIHTAQVMSPPFTVDEEVTFVAVFDNGENIVTRGPENDLKVWSVKAGRQVGGELHGHQGLVSCVTVTPDGRYIVSGSWDCTVRLWSTETHEQIGAPLLGHTGGVECVSVSKDGRRIVSGSSDNTIRVWDSGSGKQVCDPLEGHASGVRCVSFLGGSDSIVSCSWDGSVRVWDVRRKKIEGKADRHSDFVSSVSFAPNGEFVVSGSNDCTLRIWDPRSGRQIGDPLRLRPYYGRDLKVLRNGRDVLVVMGNDVGIWNMKARKLLHKLTGHTGPITSLAVTREGDRAMTGSLDGTVRVWDLFGKERNPIELKGYRGGVLSVFVTDDDSQVVAIDEADEAYVWEIQTERCIKRTRIGDTLRWSKEEVLNFVGEDTVCDNGGLSVQLYSDSPGIVYREGRNTKVLATMECRVWSWALSPDKRIMCVGLQNGYVGFMKVEL